MPTLNSFKLQERDCAHAVLIWASGRRLCLRYTYLGFRREIVPTLLGKMPNKSFRPNP